MENTIVILETRRSHYSAKDAAEHSLTVDELISYLEQYDGDCKVIFSNDNGYTYGQMGSCTVRELGWEEEA